MIAGVPAALDRLGQAGAEILFVTNNASRTSANVASKIARVTGFPASSTQVITSSMAAAGVLEPDDFPVLVVGESGITTLFEERGFPMTSDPAEARSVVVGVTPNITYQWLADAADAVRGGARFIATNIDPTFPVDGGFLPGAGAIVAAVATAGGSSPIVVGKPEEPMRRLVKQRLSGSAWVIGDRLDSDIAMAGAESEWTSILVMTGASQIDDDTRAADHVVNDLMGAVELIVSHEDLAEAPGE